MKRLLFVVGAVVLMSAPSRAQAQTAQAQIVQPTKDMTASEFRQVLQDLSSFLDAHKGTDLSKRLEALPDDGIMKIYQAIADPRRLQGAVARLKQADAARPASTRQMRKASTPSSPSTPDAIPLISDAVYPDCPANTIIDDSSASSCTPSYPDPTNSAWQVLVAGPSGLGAFSSDYYSDISPESCSLTVQADLSQIVSGLQGAVLVSSAICGALPPIASNICWAIESFVSYADAVSVGFNADCQLQGSLVTGAQVEAAFHNTVTDYNSLQSLGTQLTNVNSGLSLQLTNVDTHAASEFSALDTHVASEFAALDAHMVTLINQLTKQDAGATALLTAYLKEVMRLQLTIDQYKRINPTLLTCTGTNCPNVLANCPAAGCSWNNVGP